MFIPLFLQLLLIIMGTSSASSPIITIRKNLTTVLCPRTSSELSGNPYDTPLLADAPVTCRWKRDILGMSLYKTTDDDKGELMTANGIKSNSVRSIDLRGDITQNIKSFEYPYLMMQIDKVTNVQVTHDRTMVYIISKDLHVIWTFNVDHFSGGILVVHAYAGQRGISGYSGDDGDHLLSKLNAPHTVLPYLNRVYVTDSMNLRVRSVHVISGIITTLGVGEVFLSVVGDRGYLLLSTFSGDIVFMSIVSGMTNPIAGLGFTGPIHTLLLDCTHNIVYAAELTTNRVLSFPIYSNVTTVVVGPGVSRGLTTFAIEHPVMYVADTVDQNVKVLTLCEEPNCPYVRYGVSCHEGSMTRSRTQGTPTPTGPSKTMDDEKSLSSSDEMTRSATQVAVPEYEEVDHTRDATIMVVGIAALMGVLARLVRGNVPCLSRVLLCCAVPCLGSLHPELVVQADFGYIRALHPITWMMAGSWYLGAAIADLIISAIALLFSSFFQDRITSADVSGYGGAITSYFIFPISMGAANTVLHGSGASSIAIGLGILCVVGAGGYQSHIRGLVIPHYLRLLALRYRGTHVWFLTFDVALDIVVGMVAGWQPSDGQGVGLQFFALTVLLNVHVGLIYMYKPYTLRSHVWIEIAFSSLVTVVLILRVVAVRGSSEVLIIGAVLVLIMYGYILLVGTKDSDDIVTDVAVMERAAAPYNPLEDTLYDHPREMATSPPIYQHIVGTAATSHRAKDEDDAQFMYDLLVPMKAPWAVEAAKQQRGVDNRIEL